MTDAEAIQAIELILGEPPEDQYLSNVEAHERLFAISDVLLARSHQVIEDALKPPPPQPLGLLWTPGGH